MPNGDQITMFQAAVTGRNAACDRRDQSSCGEAGGAGGGGKENDAISSGGGGGGGAYSVVTVAFNPKRKLDLYSVRICRREPLLAGTNGTDGGKLQISNVTAANSAASSLSSPRRREGKD